MFNSTPTNHRRDQMIPLLCLGLLNPIPHMHYSHNPVYVCLTVLFILHIFIILYCSNSHRRRIHQTNNLNQCAYLPIISSIVTRYLIGLPTMLYSLCISIIFNKMYCFSNLCVKPTVYYLELTLYLFTMIVPILVPTLFNRAIDPHVFSHRRCHSTWSPPLLVVAPPVRVAPLSIVESAPALPRCAARCVVGTVWGACDLVVVLRLLLPVPPVLVWERFSISRFNDD